MNNILKIFLLVLVVLFLSLYFGKYNRDYYENKKLLTDEAIARFEKDLKEGKKIVPSNYIEEEKNYNNKFSSLGVKTSNFIEKSFKKGLSVFMKKLDELQGDN